MTEATVTETTQEGPTRAGFVALIGEPNAGKSTLLNRMVGAKVSIVTHKVQTTRARIRGVAFVVSICMGPSIFPWKSSVCSTSCTVSRTRR